MCSGSVHVALAACAMILAIRDQKDLSRAWDPDIYTLCGLISLSFGELVCGYLLDLIA